MKNQRIFLLLFLGSLPAGVRSLQAETPASAKTNLAPVEIVLVEPASVTPEKLSAWKKEGFKGVALLLDESCQTSFCQRTAKAISGRSLELYYWIEVARHPALADEHPKWMASIGMHEDWQQRFPNVVPPQEDEVAKASWSGSSNYSSAFPPIFAAFS